jgi:drug/metabolite transporter (DMT)-like permease
MYRSSVRRRGVDPGVLLLLTPLMWGATFPAGKLALRGIPPLTFMAWTRGLGLVAILALVPLMVREGRHSLRELRRAVRPGLFLGVLIFVAYMLQTEGLARTTATNAGFITCLYVVFTPILAAVVFHQRVPGAAWAAVAIAVVGMALLSVQDLGAIQLHAGDLLVLGGAVGWAGHVTAIGYFAPKFPAWTISVTQMAVTFVLQLVAVAGTGLRFGTVAHTSVWPLLVITGCLGSGIAYTLQIMAQQEVTAVRAVVLLAGESVFAAAFAAVWIGERLSLHQWLGALLVLTAMTFSELAARRPPELRLEPASAP